MTDALPSGLSLQISFNDVMRYIIANGADSRIARKIKGVQEELSLAFGFLVGAEVLKCSYLLPVVWLVVKMLLLFAHSGLK